MPQPLNPIDDTDHTPDSAPMQPNPARPGPGGDEGGERQGMVPDTKDEVHGTKPASGELDEKVALGTPLGDVKTIKEKSLDHSIQNGAEEDIIETHHQEVTPGEKEASAAPVGEVRGTDKSPDAGDHNRTGSGLDGSDLDASETKEDSETTQHENKTDINTENKGSIQALLKRDLHHLTRPERSILYHEGVKQREGGHLEGALKCFLGAITGLSEGSSFKELPKCLHAISDAYFAQKEYEKAVYFIQAEKMYYETALIDIVSTENDTGSKADRRPSKEDGEENDEQLNEEAGEKARQDENNPDDDLSPDAKKGQEFENLARLCLKEGKLQLALDYCGKATKMYQTVYGEEHPVTIAALDLFTVIYADVGKQLYSDAMQKFEKEEEALKSEKSHDSMSPDSTAPGLRQRFTNSNNKELNGVDENSRYERTIHQGEFEPTTFEERDDWVITVLLMLIFFLATVFIVIVISSIYCYNNNRTGYCAQTRGDINYWYMYVRHLIHDIRKRFR